MRSALILTLAGLLLALAGCGAPPANTPTPLPATPIPTEPVAPTPPPSGQAELLARVGKGKARDALYTADGQFALVAFDTGLGVFKTAGLEEVAFWDLPTQTLRLVLLPGEKEISALTADGNLRFVGFDPANGAFSASGRAAINTGAPIRYVDEEPIHLAASPDGKLLAFSVRAGAQAWDLETGQALLKDLQPAKLEYQLGFSSDSRFLLLSAFNWGSSMGDTSLVDLSSGLVAWKYSGKATFVGGQQLMYWDNPWEYSLAAPADPKNARKVLFPAQEGLLLFSPDGKLGAFLRWDYGVQLFKPETGILFSNYEGRPPKLEYTDAPVYLSNAGLVVTYKSEQVAATPGPGGKSIKFVYTPLALDAGKGVLKPVGFTPPFEISYPLPPVAFAPDGHTFLYLNPASLVQVDIAASQQTMFEDHLAAGITALAFAPDGQTLAAGDQAFTVLYLNARLEQIRSEPLQVTEGLNYRYPGISRWYSGVTGLAFAPNGTELAADTSNGAIYTLALDGRHPPLETFLNNESFTKGGLVEMYGLALSPKDGTLATGGYENAVRLWGPPGWAATQGTVVNVSLRATLPVAKILEDSSVVTALAYSPDGEQLAAGTEKGYIRLWKPDGALERTLTGHTGRVTGLAFAGETLVSISEDGSARFWNLAEGSQTRSLNLGASGASLALDPRGEVLALGTEGGQTYLWDMQNARWLGQIPSAGVIRALAFSPDAARLALSSEVGQIQLWQVRRADGQVAQFPTGEPQTAGNLQACKLTGKFKGFEGVFVAGGQARLEWRRDYTGDCSSLDENSVRAVANLPDLAVKFSLVSAASASPGTKNLRIYADVTIPAIPGTYQYAWELAAPNGETFPFSASLTVVAAPAGLNLPAPLYFVSDGGALLRLETDARTLTPIIPAPVACMDISPASGEIAYLSDDALWLADRDGGNRRVLLPIGGCPSWSTDGTLIGFILNGVKAIKVASGEIQTLATDLHAYGVQARYYRRVFDWSPFSNKFVASVSGWESFGLRVFDLPTGDESGITGYVNPAWSLNGEYVYTGEYEYSGYYGEPPYIIRNNILTGDRETLLGNSESDLSGGFAPFETADGRLLAFIGRLANAEAQPRALAAAQMRLDAPGQFSYDPNPHPILFPAEATWWRDGSLAVVKLTGGEVLATFPFSKNTNVYLPVRGSDLRWNRFAPAVASAPAPTATLPPASTSPTASELGRYTLAFIGGAAGNTPRLATLRADGSGLLRPYPALAGSSSSNQFAWAADGKSLYVLDGTQFYQARPLDDQFYEFTLPEGLPGYVTANSSQIKAFSLSPDGRYLALVYTPADEAAFDVPNADQRRGLDNLGLLDLKQKRWIDVYIPAISSTYAGKAAILFAASAWAGDDQRFVVTVTQDPYKFAQAGPGGPIHASIRPGGGGSSTVGLVVADVRGQARNLTLASNPWDDYIPEFHPFWAQDGQIYFYSTDNAGNPGLYRIAPSGKGQTRIADCDSMDANTLALAVAPDGRHLAARSVSPEDGSSRWAIINTSSGEKTFLPPAAELLETPVWSPDGKTLAWASLDQASAPKIFLLSAEGGNSTVLDLPASLAGASHLAWSPDGKWLAFRSLLQSGSIGLYILRADGTENHLLTTDLLDTGLLLWSPVVLARP